MKKNVWNICVDGLSFVVFMLMISSGLLLKFILPPGSGRVERMLHGGRGYGQTIDLVMGLSRHEWGAIHFYISLTFLLLLIVHLILHWPWIRSVTFGSETHSQPIYKKMISLGVVILIGFILIFPWVIEKKTYTKIEFLQMRHITHTSLH